MRAKKLSAAFLLGVGLCFVPALGYGEVLKGAAQVAATNTDIATWLNLFVVGGGTISMAVVILYIEVIRPRQRKPKITIEFDNEIPFCRIARPQGSKGLGYYIRIRIENAGKSVAKGLRGKLVEVIDKNGKLHKDFDPLFLHWTVIEPVPRVELDPFVNWLDPIDLNSKEFDYLNVFYTNEEQGDLVTIATTPQDRYPRGCMKSFKMREGIKAFKITIYGENIEPKTKTYKLVWDGKKYDEVRMYELNFHKLEEIEDKLKKLPKEIKEH